jgi:hypothetical protein
VFTPIRATDEDGSTDAVETAKIVFNTAQRMGVGMIDSFVSDRGRQWDSIFWKELCRLWGVEERMSTAFHPESDGQTEIVNQELERYLRQFCSWQQDDWNELLPLAEAAQNSAPSASTKVSPFFATNGYEPRMVFDYIPKEQPIYETHQKPNVEKARIFSQKMYDIHQKLQEEIKLSQTRMEEYANRTRKPAPSYQTGDYVWLNLKNIKTTRPTKKLDFKNVRCKVLKRVSPSSYRLEMPEGMQKLHDVYHTSLLRLDENDPLPGQIQEPTPPIQVDGQNEWEIEDILDSRYYYARCQYRVKWKGQPLDLQWYNSDGFENASEITRKFHDQYPEKLAPRELRIRQEELTTRKREREDAVYRGIIRARERK